MTLKSLEGVDIQSLVHYSNIFVNSQRTHLRNGDWFVYVMEQSVSKLVKSLIIEDFPTRVIKKVIYSRYSHCQNIGHKASSDDCPARTPPEVSDSIQVFRGRVDPISNLYVYPEGCTWVTADTVHDSVKKEFQHNKVQLHGLEHEADALLTLTTPMEIMYHS